MRSDNVSQPKGLQNTESTRVVAGWSVEIQKNISFVFRCGYLATLGMANLTASNRDEQTA